MIARVMMRLSVAKQVSRRSFTVITGEQLMGVPKNIHPSKIDKIYLVLSRIYKSSAEIPETVSYESLQKAASRMRILSFLTMASASAGAALAFLIAQRVNYTKLEKPEDMKRRQF